MPHRYDKKTKKKVRNESDPRVKSRLEEFSLLGKTQKWLKRQNFVPSLSVEQLADTCIVHDTSFDIDLEDPIDFEMRYFLPGPVEAMERAIQDHHTPWPEFVSDFSPLRYNRTFRRASSSENMRYEIHSANEASNMGEYFSWLAAKSTSWDRHR
ncbi:hypothetical protein ACHAQA_002489 [Verticillium albo-atrum]